MIYLSLSKEIEVVKQHVKKEIGSYHIKRNVSFKDLGPYLLSNPFAPPCNVLEVRDTPPKKLERKIETPEFNNTFLCVNKLKDWKIFSSFKLLNLDPNSFVESIDFINNIFDPEALSWLKEKFKMYPQKIEIEMMFLFEEYKTNGLISLDYVVSKYEGIQNLKLSKAVQLYKIGNRELTKIIANSTDSELWSMFIGHEHREPYIYFVLKNKRDFESLRYLNRVQQAVRSGKINVKYSLIILSEWLYLSKNENKILL